MDTIHYGRTFLVTPRRSFLFVRGIIAALFGVVFFFIMSSPASASGTNLTDILDTKAFQGSWDTVASLDWVGKALSVFISAASVFGLAMFFMQKMATALYFASRSFADDIYDAKQEIKGTRFLNLEGVKNSLSSGSAGAGADALVHVGYMLAPNVKRYSEYNPERMGAGLDENDTVIQYLLKTALPSIMIIFFLSMGFNGTLAKGYGTVVDGFAAAADKAVDTNLDAFVTRILSTGESYKFSLGASNTEEAQFAERIARDLYGKVLSRGQLVSTEERLEAGHLVEQWVYNLILNTSAGSTATGSTPMAKLSALLQKSGSLDTKVTTIDDVKALRYEIIINTNPTAYASESANVLLASLTSRGAGITSTTATNASQLSTLGQKLTAHLVITKDRVSEGSFFNTQK